jgi:uncharacterized cupin superfamily protein
MSASPQHLGNVAELDLPPDPVADASYAHTSTRCLEELNGARIGVWEVEAGHIEGATGDEVFVIISGSATIHFSVTGEIAEVGPGDIVRLRRGELNVWDVHEKVRKLYVNAGNAPTE